MMFTNLSWPTIRPYLLLSCFFLPYIGGTHFRLDQLIGCAAIIVAAFYWRSMSPTLRIFWYHGLTILLIVVLRGAVQFPDWSDFPRAIVNFSYAAAGVSLAFLTRTWSIRREIMIISLFVNGVATLMSFFPQ